MCPAAMAPELFTPPVNPGSKRHSCPSLGARSGPDSDLGVNLRARALRTKDAPINRSYSSGHDDREDMLEETCIVL